MKIKDVITELDLLAPETAYVRLGDGSYIKANYRRTQNPHTRQDDATGFIKIEKVTPQAAKALGLDHKLANPVKDRNLRPYDPAKASFTSQGQDPWSTKHIYVVDMKDQESMSHLTDKVTAKILQYLEKNAGKTTNEAQLNEFLQFVPAIVGAVRIAAPVIKKMITSPGAKTVAKTVAKTAKGGGNIIVKNPGKALVGYGVYETFKTAEEFMAWLKGLDIVGLGKELALALADIVVKNAIPIGIVLVVLVGGMKLINTLIGNDAGQTT